MGRNPRTRLTHRTALLSFFFLCHPRTAQQTNNPNNLKREANQNYTRSTRERALLVVTLDVVQRIKNTRAPWIRIVRLPWQTVGGAGPATNAGLDCAGGKYVLLLDGDDVMLPTAVEELVRVAEAAARPPDYVMAQYLEFYAPDQSDAHEGYDMAVGRYWKAADNSLTAGATQSGEGELFHPLAEPGFENVAVVPWRNLMRRDFLDEHGIRMREVDGVFEDSSFKMALDVRAQQVVTVHKVLFHKRKGRPGATTVDIPSLASSPAPEGEPEKDSSNLGDTDVELEGFQQLHPIITRIFDYVQQFGYMIDEMEDAAARARNFSTGGAGADEQQEEKAAPAVQEDLDALDASENGDNQTNAEAEAEADAVADAARENYETNGSGGGGEFTHGFAPPQRNAFAQRFASTLTSTMRMFAFESVGQRCDQENAEENGAKRPWNMIRAQNSLVGPVHMWSDEGIAAMTPREAAVTRKWRAKLFGLGDEMLERFGNLAEDQQWTEVVDGVACIRQSLAETGAAVTRGVALTVAIPLYNTPGLAERVQAFVAGLREQPGLTFEVIVVDNNSDDGSQVDVEAVADSDPDVYFMKQPTPGAGRARNLALKAASGRFIFFLDADDTADAAALAGAVASAEAGGHDLLMLKYRLTYRNPQGGSSVKTREAGEEGSMLAEDLSMYLMGSAADDAETRKLAAYKFVNYPWIRVASREMVRRNVIFFPPFAVQNDVPYHWFTITRASNLGYFDDDKPVVTHRVVDLPEPGEVTAEGMQTITNIRSLERLQSLQSMAYTYRQLMKIDDFALSDWAPGVWVTCVSGLLNFASTRVPQGTEELYKEAGNLLLNGMFQVPDDLASSATLRNDLERLGESHELKFRSAQAQCNEYRQLMHPEVQNLLDNHVGHVSD